MTKLLDGFSHNGILQAVEILKNGGIVALPTETVYGLAADASNPNAIKKIFTAKNRPENHPLILHVQNFGEVKKYAKDISNSAKILAENFWPGPLSMLFQKNDSVSNLITGGKDTVVTRCPKHKIFQEVLKLGNFALVAPSANLHKKLSPTKAEHVMEQMSGLIDAVLDGGTCEVGVESTIADVSSEDVKILRAGPILQNEIENVLHIKIEDISSLNTNNVSGSMKVHYQPHKPVTLFKTEEISNCIKNYKNSAFIVYSQKLLQQIDPNFLIQMPANALQYQAKLYDTLHKIDKENYKEILIEMPPHAPEWLAIYDKLHRMVAK